MYDVHGTQTTLLTVLSNVTACKALDDLIDIRLFREENQTWIEKAVITRIWIVTTDNFIENALEQLEELLDTVLNNSKAGPALSAPATHAAQTVWCSDHRIPYATANIELPVVVEESRGYLFPRTT
jgi:hypothetical protein